MHLSNRISGGPLPELFATAEKPADAAAHIKDAGDGELYRGTLAKSPLDTQVAGSHYKGMKIQPMEFSMANALNACQHSAIKYVSRKKGGKEQIIEDRRKAIHCIEMEIEMIESGLIEV